jgi:uncharacterized protein (DUF983 family)
MQEPISNEKRVWPAMKRGLACKCPKCGKGWLFHHYLEQVDACANCGEHIGEYKAGLFTSLVVITLIVHVVAVLMLDMELRGANDPMFYLYILVPVTLFGSLAVMPPIKGAIIGLMWAKGWSDEQDR